jgi:hypothetical protein
MAGKTRVVRVATFKFYRNYIQIRVVMNTSGLIINHLPFDWKVMSRIFHSIIVKNQNKMLKKMSKSRSGIGFLVQNANLNFENLIKTNLMIQVVHFSSKNQNKISDNNSI